MSLKKEGKQCESNYIYCLLLDKMFDTSKEYNRIYYARFKMFKMLGKSTRHIMNQKYVAYFQEKPINQEKTQDNTDVDIGRKIF